MIMDAALDTLMPGDGVVIEGGSDKAIFDKEREIKKAKYVEIRELKRSTSCGLRSSSLGVKARSSCTKEHSFRATTKDSSYRQDRLW